MTDGVHFRTTTKYNHQSKKIPNSKLAQMKEHEWMADYTPRQGQFLAFIYYYSKLNRCAPAEADMQRYFGISAPSVHSMVVKLAELGFISREAGKPRSITLLLSREELPDLD